MGGLKDFFLMPNFFTRTRLMLLRLLVFSLRHSRWSGRRTLIFPCYKQATFEWILFIPSGIEDFAFSRRRIENLPVWPMFQFFHPTLLEKKNEKNETMKKRIKN